MWSSLMTSLLSSRLHVETPYRVREAAVSYAASQDVPYFHVTIEFITMFTNYTFARPLPPIPQASWIQSISSLPKSLTRICHEFSTTYRGRLTLLTHDVPISSLSNEIDHGPSENFCDFPLSRHTEGQYLKLGCNSFVSHILFNLLTILLTLSLNVK
jgi:hypothetical protein